MRSGGELNAISSSQILGLLVLDDNSERVAAR